MPDVLGASTGAIGLGPYGDRSEHSGPPEIITIPDTFRPFFATDARSILITLFPQHFNFIPNPAFRVDTTGWEINGVRPAPTSYSWTFVGGTGAENKALLDSIIAGTTSAVEPDPSTVGAYQNGQIVWISGVDVWLVVDDTATLTVAEASAQGLTISADTSGYRVWDVDDSLSAEDSWVGQSFVAYGSSSLRYRAGADQFIYVGPKPETLSSGTNIYSYAEYGSAQWTFSVYVRGSGRVRLTMDAYNPADRTDAASGPEYQDLVTVADPFVEPAGDPAILGPEGNVWVLIDPAPSEAPFYESLDRPPAFASVVGPWEDIEDDGLWHRVVLTTRARVEENEGQVSFAGAWWIDGQIEVENGDPIRVSAAMLDPKEYPECAYFDGDMAEDPNIDDFIWEGNANNSISHYYFDRQLRTRWLWERLNAVVPAGRPYQIFFGAYDRPYIPPPNAEVAGG